MVGQRGPQESRAQPTHQKTGIASVRSNPRQSGNARNGLAIGHSVRSLRLVAGVLSISISVMTTTVRIAVDM
ncbi:hypothetical protein F4777DRAFT_580264 [Nemania sp. FL0916]|nr:hypothetical protein F4777DRAFT_580264 [Nemania sp. FL0916]